MMSEEQFWQIVAELQWPQRHYAAAQLYFMDRWSADQAQEFESHFRRAKAALNAVADVEWICDSWDDTKAHVVGLGREAWQAHIADPAQLRHRMETHQYVESFAYCIPTEQNYARLTDEGYTRPLRHLRRQLDRFRATPADDISPRMAREIAGIEAIAALLLDHRWQEAVEHYHREYGPGYADHWPPHVGYLVPNIISDLEIFRLRLRVPEWNSKEGKED